MSSPSIPPDLVPYLTGEKTDYTSYQSSIIIVNITVLSIAGITAFLRFYVRFVVLRSPGLDDFLLGIALLFSILLTTSCLVGRNFGLGKHLWNLSADLLELPLFAGRITKSLYGAYLAYSTAITFTKLSIIALYFRVFPRNQSGDLTQNILIRTLLITAVIVVSFWVCSIFAIIFTCIPVRAAWDYTISDAKCFPIWKFFYVSAGFNIATDLVLCFLPLPTLWALKMSKAQKIVLSVLLSIGTFACIASIIRLTQLHYLGNFDISYTTVTSLNWSVIEVGTAITCTSLSALRPIASRLLPSLFSQFSQYPQPNSHASQQLSRSRKKKSDRFQDSLSGHLTNTISVERTFELLESEVLPGLKGSAISRSEISSEGASNHAAVTYGRSSEEQLVGIYGAREAVSRR